MTSFLSDVTYDPLETWLLPKSDMLCMIRCQEDPPGDVHEYGQVAKSMDEENQRKKASSPPRPRTSGQGPGHPAPEDVNNSSNPAIEVLQGPDIRPHAPDIRLLPKARKSGPFAGHPTPPIQRLQKFCTASPDIRPLLKPRTSGPTPGHPAPPVCAQ